MLLAEIDIWQSRPMAPTRRVAVGSTNLPVHPAPGFGGLLLAAVVAAHVEGLDPDLVPELRTLIRDLEDGRRIPQPRLRHRFQVDRIGLNRTTHRLFGDGERLTFGLDGRGRAAPQILGAVYAAGDFEAPARTQVMQLILRALQWSGAPGPELLAYLTGRGGTMWSVQYGADPQGWALSVLGFTAEGLAKPDMGAVQRRFRRMLRQAHPDHGGDDTAAAERIADLVEARRILRPPA